MEEGGAWRVRDPLYAGLPGHRKALSAVRAAARRVTQPNGHGGQPPCPTIDPEDPVAEPAFDVLSPVDAQLWDWDTPETPMVMGNVCLFDGRPFFDESGNFRLADVRRSIESRLHLVPRYRRRIVDVPLGRPILVDDPSFDIANHVQLLTLPEPGTEEQLKAAFAQVHEGLLDHSRPLWKIVFIQGLADGRVGMIQKIHHSPFDGATTVRIMETLFDSEPKPKPAPPPPWHPQPAPQALQVVAENIRGSLQAAWRLGTGPHGPSLSPRRLGRSVRTLAALRGFLPAPPTSLNGPIGPRRRFDWIHTTLPDVKCMRQQVTGSTLNDVMLTAVAEGLRELFLARGEDVAHIRPRVFVPVDVRDEAGAEAGNVFSALVLPLPIDEPDVVARLRVIANEMATLKSGHQTQAMRLAMNLSELIPPVLLAAGARQTHNRGMFMNLTVTNVPGPRRELYLLGAKMLELNPMLPLGTGLTLNVAVESYVDRLSVGLCCDPEKVPDLDVFKRGVATALDELLARAIRSPYRGKETS